MVDSRLPTEALRPRVRKPTLYTLQDVLRRAQYIIAGLVQQSRELLCIVRHTTIEPRCLDGNVPLGLEDADGGFGRQGRQPLGSQSLSHVEERRVKVVVVVLFLVMRKARMEVARQRSLHPGQVPTSRRLPGIVSQTARRRARSSWGARQCSHRRHAEGGSWPGWDGGHWEPLTHWVDEGEENDHAVGPGYEAPEAGLKHPHTSRGKATINDILREQP